MSETNEHTPGPWYIESEPYNVWDDENARLIAAAPDLLAALKGFEYPDEPGRFCDHAGEPCPRCEAALAAIAKAEGAKP